MPNASQAESHCVDGDIRLVAGENDSAALAYLRAYLADAVIAKEHVSSLSDEQRDSLLTILRAWTDGGWVVWQVGLHIFYNNVHKNTELDIWKKFKQSPKHIISQCCMS